MGGVIQSCGAAAPATAHLVLRSLASAFRRRRSGPRRAPSSRGRRASARRIAATRAGLRAEREASWRPGLRLENIHGAVEPGRFVRARLLPRRTVRHKLPLQGKKERMICSSDCERSSGRLQVQDLFVGQLAVIHGTRIEPRSAAIRICAVISTGVGRGTSWRGCPSRLRASRGYFPSRGRCVRPCATAAVRCQGRLRPVVQYALCGHGHQLLRAFANQAHYLSACLVIESA